MMLDTLQLMNFAAENEKLKAFSDFLKSENAKYNLTAVTDDKEIISKHFFDSLVGERFLEKGANVCDIGSGAGFPLIPLAVLRGDCSFTGVDSTQKKVNFINAACAMLDIKNCYAVHARAEEIKPRGSFSAVTARAVASLNTLCEYCLPVLRVDGVMIAYKGSAAEEEVAEAEKALDVLGGRVEEIFRYTLPTGEDRAIVKIRKTAPTPAKYPRPGNKPRLKPIK